jgi:uncharacterized repeat protein (TIGR03943 family)
MRAKVSNALNGLTLVGLGSVFVIFYLSGRIDRYLNPLFRPLVLFAGAGAIIAGLVYLLTTHSGQCCIDGDCVHRHINRPAWSLTFFGVICLSVLAGAMFSKDAFDQQIVANRGFIEDATKLPGSPSFRPGDPQNRIMGAHINEALSDSGDLPIAEDGNAELEVTDLLYAETQEPLRKTILGKTVEVVGQFISGDAPGRFKLVRIFMWCCAADARPVYVPVEISGPLDVSDMEWVRVIGTAEFSTNDGHTRVLLRASDIEVSDPPAEAMLFN